MNYKVSRYFLKTFSCAVFVTWTAGCQDNATAKRDSLPGDSFSINRTPAVPPSDTGAQQKKLSILVLPPYDEIANEGISPDVQQYLEEQIGKDTNFTLVKFSYKEFMNVPYQNIYDKKYCQPVMEKKKADVMLMSKLELIKTTGKMNEGEWSVSLNMYNTITGTQREIRLGKTTEEKMKKFLQSKQKEIERTIHITEEQL